eukprot:5662524-Lingulodinium_polyedra.AAC.1
MGGLVLRVAVQTWRTASVGNRLAVSSKSQSYLPVMRRRVAPRRRLNARRAGAFRGVAGRTTVWPAVL